MQRLGTQTRFTMAMGLAGGLTILSGFAMYEHVSGRFQLAWMGTGTGLALTIGGLAGILAAIPGGMVGAAGQRIGAVAREIASAGATPAPAQMAEIQSLQTRIQVLLSRWTAILLLVAVVAMAAARYV